MSVGGRGIERSGVERMDVAAKDMMFARISSSGSGSVVDRRSSRFLDGSQLFHSSLHARISAARGSHDVQIVSDKVLPVVLLHEALLVLDHGSEFLPATSVDGETWQVRVELDDDLETFALDIVLHLLRHGNRRGESGDLSDSVEDLGHSTCDALTRVVDQVVSLVVELAELVVDLGDVVSGLHSGAGLASIGLDAAERRRACGRVLGWCSIRGSVLGMVLLLAEALEDRSIILGA